ncbi:MAG TPA: PD-(D/E)XK nuclease family protein [Solirubrobacteraceae bacterium]|nr:PD-(D/E)XK nuclease family protein [Solirubrobacteraceae bacterium]
MAGSQIAPAPPPDGPPGAKPGEGTASALSRPAAAAAGDERGGAFLKRPEVRDVLAWMRLLVDPQDSAAVVRALARPPIELRQVELARVIQVARRRTSFGGAPLGGGQAGKRDLVLGLSAATESPQVPPETRERVQRFVELHRTAAAELDGTPPDVFVARLIELLSARSRSLLTPEDAAQRRASLDRLRALAVELVRTVPLASTRELVRHLATVLPAADPEERADPDPKDELQAAFHALRGEVLDGIAHIGGRLGELRLDTDLDVAHGVVRYLELLKLSALLQRPDGQELAGALADVNARLLAAATPLQREILQTSSLDATLLANRAAVGQREPHSLGPFLPRKGAGLALSASDIHTYRSCPLRYKYARVLRIPTEQTVHQRFGIVVHQVLERYHRERGETLAQMHALLDSSSRRAGFREEEPAEAQLLDKAREALTRYHARLRSQESKPLWFERQFDFRIGPHHVRGRVDRVDRVAGAEYELIDYKTSRPKSPEQLRADIQLSLYALAAREDWQLPSSRQAYYYVLDDLIVPVPVDGRDAQAVEGFVLEVGEGILAQEFEPTPSPGACSMCDYRIVCPVAET